MYVHECDYIHLFYISIYIYRERERERETCMPRQREKVRKILENLRT